MACSCAVARRASKGEVESVVAIGGCRDGVGEAGDVTGEEFAVFIPLEFRECVGWPWLAIDARAAVAAASKDGGGGAA